MNKKMRNLLIAVAAGGGLFLVLTILMATTPGLNIGPQATVLPLVLGGGVYAALNAKNANRKLPTASGEARAQALSFPPRPGEGYIVLIRRAKSAKPIGFDMMLDGVDATQLMVGQFCVLPVSVARHTVFADVAGVAGKSGATPVEVLVTEGSVFFFETRLAMGLTRSSVHLDPVVDTPALRAGLEKLAMALPQSEAPARKVA